MPTAISSPCCKLPADRVWVPVRDLPSALLALGQLQQALRQPSPALSQQPADTI